MPSFLVALHEFNQCHTASGPQGGQFCSDGGAAVAGKEKPKGLPKGVSPADPGILRATPIKVKTVEEGVALILQGKVIELENERAVNTLLTKLGQMVMDAKAKGEKAPSYDLCNVSVKGTNLFCVEKVRTEKHPGGIPRIEMPQFTGVPRPGSAADKLPRSVHKGKVTDRVDGAPAFVDFLEASGIKVAPLAKVPAASLKATQAELIGSKVADMVLKGGSEGQGADEPIFISRDNYVLDGHHRWAANVAKDLQDERLGDITMNAYRIDAPISKLYHLSLKFVDEFGIERAHGVYRPPGAPRH